MRDTLFFPVPGDRWRAECLYKVYRPPPGMSLLTKSHVQVSDNSSESFLEPTHGTQSSSSSAAAAAAAPSSTASSSMVPRSLFALDKGKK